jgi:glycosyltransferase involved in cell wall biosynthesis
MRNLRTEQEIMVHWQGDLTKPVVSVCCITYNHEPYIEDALEGFLIQETDFPFEILIHDDASTDRTAEIIRSYETRYPSVIKPIYQRENQFSQGKKPSVFTFKKAQAEFIAMCEGDDYWIHPRKLQNQLEKIEDYNVDFCFHDAYVIDEKDFRIKNFCYKYKETTVVPVENVIGEKRQFAPTASYFMNRAVFNQEMLKIINDAPISDYFLEVFASLKNGALYIPSRMSVYRKNSFGSWSELIHSNNDLRKKFSMSMLASLDKVDSFLNFEYSESIQKKKAAVYLDLALKSLYRKAFDEFKDNIELGFTILDIKQKKKHIKIYYYLRNFPKLIYLLFHSIKIYSTLKRNISRNYRRNSMKKFDFDNIKRINRV